MEVFKNKIKMSFDIYEPNGLNICGRPKEHSFYYMASHMLKIRFFCLDVYYFQ